MIEAFADDKDWTWVLERTCDECGYEATGWERAGVAKLIRDNVAEWQQILTLDESVLRTRPRVDKWSPLEYAYHVRDVFELYHFRLGLMLDEDDPTYPNWDQDKTTVEKCYNEAAVETVSTELAEWAEAIAVRFEGVSGDQWERTGLRSDGAAFTIETFGRYMIHDPIHHIYDVLAELEG